MNLKFRTIEIKLLSITLINTTEMLKRRRRRRRE